MIAPTTLEWWLSRGLLDVAETVKLDGGWPVRFLRSRELKRAARDRRRATDPRARIHSDPRTVERFALRFGENRAKFLGDRALKRDRLWKSFRVGTGRPAMNHVERWEAAFGELAASDALTGKPITKQERYVLVYLNDWLEHPETWPRDEYPASRAHGDEPDPETYRRAANVIAKALARKAKALQIL